MIEDLFNDIVKYSTSMTIPSIVGFIALPIITRLFLPSDFGNYVFVLVMV